MGAFGRNEFVNAQSDVLGPALIVAPSNSMELDAVATGNAFRLQRFFDGLRGANCCLYFPPGRYFIGRRLNEREPLERPGSDWGLADIVVPANVTLKFAPNAMLVPMAYSQQRVVMDP